MTGNPPRSLQEAYYDELLREKYAKGDEQTVDDVFARVAKGLSAVEPESQREGVEKRFLETLRGGFYPGGRISSAAGTTIKATLLNCFVQPVGDSITSGDPADPGIFDAQAEAAETMRRGGGVGYNFSRLRPSGARVKGTQSRSSGPISYMRVFDRMCQTVESAGARRGAQMGILEVSHPDIEAFIHAKDIRKQAQLLRQRGFSGAELEQMLESQRTLSQFNISVGMTNAFMAAVEAGGKFELVHVAEPDSSVHPNAHRREDGLWVYKTVDARALFDDILETTYHTADPGVVFLDTMNLDNNLHYAEKIIATNPCVTADTWVHTQQGPRQVSSLVGQQSVLRIDGADHVTAAAGFFSTGVKPVLKLSTQEGFTQRLTTKHLIRKVTRHTRFRQTQEWVEAGSLVPGDEVVLNDHRPGAFWPGRGTHAEGYLLGALIGDGVLREDEARLSVWPRPLAVGCNDGNGIMREILSCIEPLRKRADFKGFRAVESGGKFNLELTAIRDLAFAFDLRPDRKTITAACETTSSEFHCGMLRGLFDADGSPQGSQRKGISIRLSQSNLELLQAAQRMLLRIGVVSTLYTDRRPAGWRDLPDGKGGLKPSFCQAQHELVIARDSLNIFHTRVGFADEVKAQRLDTLLQQYSRPSYTARYVATVLAVEPDGEEEVFDVQVPGINAFDANGFMVHNCGEVPLPAYGCCCLGSIDLTKLVVEPFTSHAHVDFSRLRQQAAWGVRILDNVLDASHWPLEKQRLEAQQKRRIGMGITGLGSMFVMLGLRYGSDDSIALAKNLMREIRDSAYHASIQLAAEKGPFPLFHCKAFLNSGYAQRLPTDIRQLIAKDGIRNSHLLSIAPTGTISQAFGRNVTGGIEPAFDFRPYSRFKRMPDGSRASFDIEDFAVRKYREVGGDSAKLPAYFVSVQNGITVEDHLAMQAAIQPYVDQAISKTVNIPKSYGFEEFKAVYTKAWKLGLKGCTTYRENDVTGAVLVAKSETPQVKADHQADPDRRIRLDKLPEPALNSLKWPDRPQLHAGNPSWTYLIDQPGMKCAVFVGHVENGHRYPFEVWVNGAEQPRGLGAIAKLLSMDMRSRDRAWLQLKLAALKKTRGNAVDLIDPTSGQPVRLGSATAVLAHLVESRCQQLGAFETEGPTPVLGALMSPKEPKTRAEGTMSWSVDVKNHNTGDDFVLTLKELTMPDGSRRPYSLWLAGDYPRDFDGLCKLLSIDMRVLDPAWIAMKLRKLFTYPEPMGDFLAPVPGSEKSQNYPSTVAYVAHLVAYRFKTLGLFDSECQPKQAMGILEQPAAAATAEHAVAIVGKECPHCHAYAVIRRDGCNYCTACGDTGNCS